MNSLKKNYKVQDHCHVTGIYRGPACLKCNFAKRMSRVIPVIFHNLKGYDGHLLLPELAKLNKKINIIPNTMQSYMSFSIGKTRKYFDKKTREPKEREEFNLRFIDSLGFMSASLSNLVDNLKDGGIDKFYNLVHEFGKEDAELLTRKGVYPYSYMDMYDKFEVDPMMVKKEDFRNDLTGEDITDDDYIFYETI